MEKEIRFRDERFTRGGFRESAPDARFRQRCLIEDGTMFCETVTEADCTLEEALRQVCGPWDWWDHGRVSGFPATGEYRDQVLAPVAGFMTRVEIREYEPMPWSSPELGGPLGYRVPVRLAGHFEGTATVDILEKKGGGVILRGRFHGVKSHVPYTPACVAAWMHLRAESGTMPWPFPQGTGFKGLLRRLEGGVCRAIPARAGFALNPEALAG